MTNNLHYKCQTSSHSCRVSHGVQTTNPPLAFRLRPLRMNRRFWLSSFLRFEVRKWHVALHSFAVLVSPLSWLSNTAGLYRNNSEAYPPPPSPRPGLFVCVFSHLARCDCLVLGFNRNDWRNATWIGSQLPSLNDRHTLLKEGDIGWEAFSSLGLLSHICNLDVEHRFLLQSKCSYKRTTSKS